MTHDDKYAAVLFTVETFMRRGFCLTYTKCQNGLVPTYSVRRPADTQAIRRIRSASSTSLDVRRTCLSTGGKRVFPVAAARLWNITLHYITNFF